MRGIAAFSFASPWMLGGLLLAGIPLLIHLLYRRRYQEIPWAAVSFLSGAVRRNAQRNRLQQLLLLLVRTLAIVLLVLAFAKPLVEASLGVTAPSEPTQYVFVIDGSLSMRARDNDKTRFQQAVESIARIVNRSTEGDGYQLLRIDRDRPTPVVAQLTRDRTQFLRELKQLKCSAERGDLLAASRDALAMLEEEKEIKKQRVYFVSDLQSNEWANDRLADEFQKIANAAEVVLVNMSGRRRDNLSVSRAEVDRRFIKAGDTIAIRVMAKNFGSESISNCRLRLEVDGRVVATKAVSVKRRTILPVRFRHRLTATGFHRIAVKVDDNVLKEDNASNLVVRVFDQVPVLLVNGKVSGQRMGNATDFLRLSLAPDETQSDWNSTYRVRVISEAELSRVDLKQFPAVFLCNIRQFTSAEVEQLQEYTTAGGGLVICVGDQVDQANYNTRLGGADGLLPARLDGVIGNAAAPKDAFVFDSTQLDHPLLSVYRGNPGHGLEQSLTFQYLKAEPRQDKSTRVVLSLTNDDPALIETSYGLGTVVLSLIAGDDSRWSTWNTASGTFATLMNEVAEFVVSQVAQEAERTVVGDIVKRPTLPGDIVTASLNDEVDVASESADTATEVLVGPVSESGFLDIRYGATRNDIVACNIDDAESDLRSLNEDLLRSRFLSDVEFRFLANEAATSSWRREEQPTGHTASAWLLGFAFLFLLIEQLLASRSGYRYWIALGALVAMIVGGSLLPGSNFGAVAIAVVAVGIVAMLAVRAKFRTRAL